MVDANCESVGCILKVRNNATVWEMAGIDGAIVEYVQRRAAKVVLPSKRINVSWRGGGLLSRLWRWLVLRAAAVPHHPDTLPGETGKYMMEKKVKEKEEAATSVKEGRHWKGKVVWVLGFRCSFL